MAALQGKQAVSSLLPIRRSSRPTLKAAEGKKNFHDESVEPGADSRHVAPGVYRADRHFDVWLRCSYGARPSEVLAAGAARGSLRLAACNRKPSADLRAVP